MALVLEAINNVKRRARSEARNPATQRMLDTMFQEILNNLGNPDLKIVFFSDLETSDHVISDSPCRLYCVFLKKPAASTVDAWFKGSDHATTAAANGDITAKMIGTGGGGQEKLITYGDGLILGTGLTVASHTTVSGSTDSAAADAPNGFAIVGAPRS